MAVTTWRLLLLIAAFCISSALSSKDVSSPAPSLLANKRVCIVGGGPCGLYLAALMLQEEPTVRIDILDSRLRPLPQTRQVINAYGIGMGTRLTQSLTAVPGLKERVYARGALLETLGVPLVSRADLANQMAEFLEETVPQRKCRLRYDEGCAEIDFQSRQVTTTRGRKLKYDLLVGADGVHSVVRKSLVALANSTLKQEHCLEPIAWKALHIPPQPAQTGISATSFPALRHPSLGGGRILPRYPEGHSLLMLWNVPENNATRMYKNPGNITTPEQLEALVKAAAVPPKRHQHFLRRVFGILDATERNVPENSTSYMVFDQEALEQFLQRRPGRSHYLKVSQYHHDDSPVALVGDAAHCMNSFLGQGCATGLKSAQTLVSCLVPGILKDPKPETIPDALQLYSARAVPEAHAITDLNLLACLFLPGMRFIMLILVIPFLLLQRLRGKALTDRLTATDVTYSQIRNENRFLVALAEWKHKKSRVPVESNTQQSWGM